ncbi:MAG: hypothetical protein BWK80_19945 [Desulfobacteraceae bacterium IS3]|nr:MAG: hypothetical protein BWK80_19945 [Desulfobacteraceae bacterium IS3]
MKKMNNVILGLAVFLMLISGALYAAMADHDKHGEKKSHQESDENHGDDHGSKHRGKNALNLVNNAVYKEACGACHFAYQPELLPAASWEKIIAGLGDHFGEQVTLSPEAQSAVATYLAANSANSSSAKRAVKMMKSLGNQAPLRISEIPYIREKHHEISPEVLKRKSVGSLSNCAACHRTAEAGIYDDDNVLIPQQ